MKRICLVLGLFFLSGCSLDPDAAEKYKAEEQLEASIDVSKSEIRIETSPQAVVSVIAWKEGGEIEKLAAKKTSEGVFVAEKEMTENGVYFVKADIKTAGQHIMPTKKIVIGKQEEPAPDKPKPKIHSHH